MKSAYQGLLFAYQLTPTRLNLKLLRFIPLGTIRLDRIASMRRAGSREFFSTGWHRVFCSWKYWHWPYPLQMLFCRAQVVYLLETYSGIQVFVRLKPSFHYMLRTSIGDHQARTREREEEAAASADSGNLGRRFRAAS